MAVQFQYNKISLLGLEKQLKMRERSLPTIKNKESALRLEVKRTRAEYNDLVAILRQQFADYDNMAALWNEFDASLLSVKDVELSMGKTAGVRVPILDNIVFETKVFSLFNTPKWYTDGLILLKKMLYAGIEIEFCQLRLNMLDHARKKTTQKVNLFEKVQIPGYQDAILKIKRFMEDEENLSKSTQKIMKSHQEAEKEVFDD
ncbi:MAG: V-type ATP synthase subunit D [Bacteroidales bacterium]|jgi:V/A-type H+-transporting ATPase subunit D|nr:V-type ATP synthase subunit D [Bacteroidales bacterium]